MEIDDIGAFLEYYERIKSRLFGLSIQSRQIK